MRSNTGRITLSAPSELDPDDVDTEVIDASGLPLRLRRRAPTSTWRQPPKNERRISGLRTALRKKRNEAIQAAALRETGVDSLPVASFEDADSSAPPCAIQSPPDGRKPAAGRFGLKVLLFFSLTVVIGLVGGWFVGWMNRGAIASAPPLPDSATDAGALTVRAVAAPSATPESIDAEARAPTVDTRDFGESDTTVEAEGVRPSNPAEVQSCIAGFFDAGSFVDGFEPNVGFLCEDRDFRGVTSLFERLLIAHGAGKVTPAMMVWSNLRWYQMAATATIRGRCCPSNTAPIKLPPTAAPCDQLDEALQKVADTGTSSDPENLAESYSLGVLCFYLRGVPHSYHYRRPPGPSSRRQFESFLKHAAR